MVLPLIESGSIEIADLGLEGVMMNAVGTLYQTLLCTHPKICLSPPAPLGFSRLFNEDSQLQSPVHTRFIAHGGEVSSAILTASTVVQP